MSAAGGQLIRVPRITAFIDDDAERSVLGAVMLSPAVLEGLTELRLQPQHFYRDRHQHIYAAMQGVAAAGDGCDPVTVAAELERRGQFAAAGGRAELDTLAGAVYDVGNLVAYAKRVIELAEWRARAHACLDALEAVGKLDTDGWQSAMRTIAGAEDSGRADEQLVTVEQLASEFFDYLGGAGEQHTIPTPFHELDAVLRGGWRPGDTTVIAGWTTMGKSVIVDQFLEHALSDSARSGCLYVNEMGRIERIARLLAGRGNVSFTRLLERDLTPNEWRRAIAALPQLPFPMQPCANWSADRIAAHIRRHRWDMAVVDLVTQIPARDVADLDEISRTLTQAARETGCHLHLVLQLNQQRASTLRPAPVLRDLRGTGAWANDARNVVFVHRHEELRGEPPNEMPFISEEGYLHVAKQSNGPLGVVPVFLDERLMRFVATSSVRVDRGDRLADRIAP